MGIQNALADVKDQALIDAELMSSLYGATTEKNNSMPFTYSGPTKSIYLNDGLKLNDTLAGTSALLGGSTGGLTTAKSMMDPDELAWRAEFDAEDLGSKDPGMFQSGLDFLGKNKDGIGTAMGLAGLAMNAYNMFGPGMDMHKKNMQLADQNIAANKEALDRRARLNDAYAKSFGGGLAASAAKVG